MARNNTHQDELEQFFKTGTRLSFKKGELVIRAEDTPEGVFFIESGFVKSYAITKYGEENLLIIRKSGQIFPIIWTFINEGGEVFYEAMSDLELFRVDRSAYLDVVKRDVDMAMSVLEQVVEMYRVHSNRVINLEYRSAAERVAYRLITLANRFGKKTKQGIVIEAPIRHFDIAASVNCSRETASRELSKLEKKKFISSSDGKIVILDLEAIKEKVEQKRRLERFRSHTPKYK
jgi:CRP/FNR family transcriptional regulator